MKISNKEMSHGRIVSDIKKDQYLDTIELNRLEESFREWSKDSKRRDVQLSRKRIVLIFLLIRYTGAKLHEVLAIDPLKDIDHAKKRIFFRNSEQDTISREVHLSESLSMEIEEAFKDKAFMESFPDMLKVDPGFVRRKFYDQAEKCGFEKRLGGPEMIRKARGVELMNSNMPLPAVQMLLGHSSPNLTTSMVSFSKEEMNKVTKLFMERESTRKTSARNSFFGKIIEIQCGTIQARVEIITTGGFRVTTLITIGSLHKLSLKKNMLVAVEVKAPWVILEKNDKEPACSAENRFRGIIEKINPGSINSEFVVRISDGTRLCSVATTKSGEHMSLKTGDSVWAIFNSSAVVLRFD